MSHLGLPCKQIACKAEAERGTEEKIGPSLLFCHFPNQSRRLSPLSGSQFARTFCTRLADHDSSPNSQNLWKCVERNLAALLLYRKKKFYLAMLHHSLDLLTLLKMKTITTNKKISESCFFRQQTACKARASTRTSSRLARLG